MLNERRAEPVPECAEPRVSESAELGVSKGTESRATEYAEPGDTECAEPGATECAEPSATASMLNPGLQSVQDLGATGKKYFKGKSMALNIMY